MASPCLDHRLPGAGAVCLFVSRRTISLSVNEELEQGQGVLLWEGADESRAHEGWWPCCSCSSRAASSRMGAADMAVGKAMIPALHSSAVSLKISKNVVPLGATPLAPAWLWGVTIRQLLLGSGWGRGWRGARQKREVWANLPAPGQGLRGLGGLWSFPAETVPPWDLRSCY